MNKILALEEKLRELDGILKDYHEAATFMTECLERIAARKTWAVQDARDTLLHVKTFFPPEP